MYEGELIVGFSYADAKRNVRKIVGMGSQYAQHDGQADKACLRYRVMAQRRGPYRPGAEMNCTEASFRRWATRRIQNNTLTWEIQRKREWEATTERPESGSDIR